MRFHKMFLLIILSVFLMINISGQVKQISEKEYDQILDSARDKLSSVSYRAKSKLVVYNDDGSIYLTVDWERGFLKPNKRYYKNTRVINGETEKLEQIQIGQVIYCKKDNAKWVKSKSLCESSSFSPASKIVDSTFSVEETKFNELNVRLFEKYFTYASFSNTSKTFFTREKSWINSEGLILRQEIENGSNDKNKIPNKEIIEFEYNLKDLKILAPIK